MSTLPQVAPTSIDSFYVRTLLSRIPLFAGLSPAAIDALAARVQLRRRPAGSVLLAECEGGDALYFVAQGRAKVVLAGESGREVTLSILRVGEFFGEGAFLETRSRGTIVAVDPCTFIGLPRENVLEHLRDYPQTAVRMLTELSRRLRDADGLIAELALHDVEERLVRTLVRLARSEGEQQEEGLYLRRRPTQQELANMVGSCRETVSRTLSALVRKGLATQRGHGLLLSRELVGTR